MRSKIFQEHPGLVIGGLIGLVIGVIFLIFGFWKTIIFLVIILLGTFVGLLLDGDGRFTELLNKLNREK